MDVCPTAAPKDVAWSCDNPYPLNCKNELGFQFTSLFAITGLIYDACPSDSRLFEGTKALTEAACIEMAGSEETNYPLADVWARLVAWKFPLVQLVFQFPRPPLGYLAEAFVLCNLLGNPISSLQHLMDKVVLCNSRALQWKAYFSAGGKFERLVNYPRGSIEYHEDFQRKWKAFSLIIDAFDEWGLESGCQAERFIKEALSRVDTRSQTRVDLMRICLRTASMLAADRSTKFLPVSIAQLLFIGSIAIGFGRTASTPPDSPSLFMNIEIHSVAFSALFLWLIPAVFLGSVIGVSQTEQAMPLILQDFRSRLRRVYDDDVVASAPLDPVSLEWLYGSDTTITGTAPLSHLSRRSTTESTKIIVSKADSFSQGSEDIPAKLAGAEHIEDVAAEQVNGSRDDEFEFEPDWVEDSTPETKLNGRLRKFSGGFYTWHPLKRWRQTSSATPASAELGSHRRGTLQLSKTISALPYVLTVNDDSRFEKYEPGPELAPSVFYTIVLPHLIVGTSAMIGMLISYFVPPRGWDCRHVGELAIYGIWLACWALDYPGQLLVRHMNLDKIRYFYIAKYLKDLLAAGAVIGVIGKTQQGVYNKCSCFATAGVGSGNAGGSKMIMLPEYFEVAGILVRTIKTLYPALAFSCMAAEILAMVFLIFKFLDGMRVFLQRDDGLPKFWKVRRWYHRRRHNSHTNISDDKDMVPSSLPINKDFLADAKSPSESPLERSPATSTKLEVIEMRDSSSTVNDSSSPNLQPKTHDWAQQRPEKR